ncbi:MULTISPECIES: hypothetical protein [unclassified Microbacterium]|uniref:hypothetical protein n=1 Tax=unclassified Microbacterium TaxID=2609290 RepID=UPI00386BD39D
MNGDTTMIDPNRRRVPVAPYQGFFPDRTVTAVLADYSPTVTVYFENGHTARVPKIGADE